MSLSKNCRQPPTRQLGHTIKICHFNIESISRDKCALLSRIMLEEGVHVICLQETHTKDDEDLRKRGFIPGFRLLSAVHHPQYGIAIYVDPSISDCKILLESTIYDVFISAVSVAGVSIINVYKPPQVQWSEAPLPIFTHPAIFVGDFNSHNSAWGYQESDMNGRVYAPTQL